MRYIIFISFIFCLTSNCSKNKKVTNSNTTITSFEYFAESRGFFYHIFIDSTSISLQKERNGDKQTKNLTKEDWITLTEYSKSLNLNTLEDLETQSDNSTRDAAAIAHFSISTSKKVYTSPSFDHGNPPIKIKPLVIKMLSIAKNIE